MQADLEMMRPEMIRKRRALKQSRGVKKAFKQWWNGMKLGGADGKMHKDIYIQLSIAVQAMLLPDLSEDQAYLTAKADWQDDLYAHEPPRATTMTYGSFYNAMFELADTWVDTVDESDYVTFVERMVESHQVGLYCT
jgi:hypothetical protein